MLAFQRNSLPIRPRLQDTALRACALTTTVRGLSASRSTLAPNHTAKTTLPTLSQRRSTLQDSLPRPVIHRRWISNDAPPRRKRELNLLAKFARPPPTTPLDAIIGGPASSSPTPTLLGQKGNKEGDVYETASTAPAAASFQDVPPPTSTPGAGAGGGEGRGGVRVATTLPAMKPLFDNTPPAPGKGSDANKSKDGPRKTEMVVEGVVLPPKPTPPGEEECCMSGCINCVYTIYAEELEQYTEAAEQARRALTAASKPTDDWPEELRPVQSQSQSRSDTTQSLDGKGRLAEVQPVQPQSMDPAMAAFLALENKLKNKQIGR